ncbi:HEXXH motif domain-containing protein [Actinomadura napierensis]|uniref:HEXXH motif domain-containing protein n=1 Tax=Actinomadura napierensis TaxID=267854 RepID=A0ABP5KDF1_9ACTN
MLLLHSLRHLDEDSYALLTRLQASAPRAVDTVLTYPSVGVRTQDALLGNREGERGGTAMLGALTAAAAIRAGIACTVNVPVSNGTAFLPSLGLLYAPGADSVRFECGAREHEKEPGWHPIRTLQAEQKRLRLELALDDIDPYRSPDVPSLRARIPLAELAIWEKLLREAWILLVSAHPAAAVESAAMLRVLVPMRPASGGEQTSATFYDSLGAVGTSLPPDALSFAVTLVHEMQHTKLTALLDLLPLTMPDGEERYYAPWREDPRPLSGLLQGAYAHLGIAAFWSRQRLVEQGDSRDRAHLEFARWRAGATRAARIIAGSGRLTPAGVRFVDEMLDALDGLDAQPVPDAAGRAAAAAGERHLRRWRERFGTSR